MTTLHITNTNTTLGHADHGMLATLGLLIRRYQTRKALKTLTQRQLQDIGIYSTQDLEQAVLRVTKR